MTRVASSAFQTTRRRTATPSGLAKGARKGGVNNRAILTSRSGFAEGCIQIRESPPLAQPLPASILVAVSSRRCAHDADLAPWGALRRL